MRIITISREFGSGGRELGKRLADALGIPCYDKEIIHEVARLQGVTPEHVERITETDIRHIYAATIGRTLSTPIYYNDSVIQLMVAEQEVIKKLASQGDCVIVGRSADIILEEYSPLNFFVYAKKESKLKRCMEREQETEKELLRQMKRIDHGRAANRRMLTDKEWGRKESYHLCINTTDIDIKAIIPGLAAYVNSWYGAEE